MHRDKSSISALIFNLKQLYKMHNRKIIFRVSCEKLDVTYRYGNLLLRSGRFIHNARLHNKRAM